MRKSGNSLLVLVARWGLAGLSALLFLTAAAAPVFASRGWSAPGAACYAALSSACHQKPERSFSLAGMPMGLCVRCSAIYAAIPAAFSIFVVFLKRPSAAMTFPVAAILFAPLAVDGVLQALSVYDAPMFRLATGALAGAGLALVWHTLFSDSPSLETAAAGVGETSARR